MKGKAIIFIGVLIGLLAGVMVLFLVSQQTTATASDPTPEPPPVVRAAQNIAKGDEVTLEAVQLVRLERGEAVPPSAVRDPMEVVGMAAAMDIPQGTILQAEMYFDRELDAASGRRASSLFQPGRVAMAMSVGDLSSVAGAVRAGDRVDVIASFEMVDVERETQVVKVAEGAGPQIPRLVTQTVLRDIEVLQIGPWTATGAAQEGTNDSVVPVAESRLVTLLVTPQDSVALKWLIDLVDEGEALVTLALRSEDETESPDTEAATLEYVMRRFRVPIPPKLDVTTTQVSVKGSVEPR